MRKRVWFGISMFLGMVMLVAWAESNWFLAGILGLMLGATVAIAIVAFPRDAAPPADRRHENTQRRRREQALKS
jgi:hypothetical protein